MFTIFFSLQMISSCSFLYFLRRWKIINFTMGDSLLTSDSSSTFVPLKTLMHTLPLAVAYLLYMVCLDNVHYVILNSLGATFLVSALWL